MRILLGVEFWNRLFLAKEKAELDAKQDAIDAANCSVNPSTSSADVILGESSNSRKRKRSNKVS